MAEDPRRSQVNEGTARLYVNYTPEWLPKEVRRRATAKANSRGAHVKKSVARRGKPPAEVMAKLHQANRG
jgi:hypothetical protein